MIQVCPCCFLRLAWFYGGHSFRRMVVFCTLKTTPLNMLPMLNVTKKDTSWWLSHPSEKYERQIGAFLQSSGWTYKHLWNHHPPQNGIFTYIYQKNLLKCRLGYLREMHHSLRSVTTQDNVPPACHPPLPGGWYERKWSENSKKHTKTNEKRWIFNLIQFCCGSFMFYVLYYP